MGWKPWKPEEDALVREHYPIQGPSWDGWNACLPGRTKASIQLRASKLGLSVERRRRQGRRYRTWTDDERKRLITSMGVVVSRTGHSLDDCLDEMTRLSDEYMRRRA